MNAAVGGTRPGADDGPRARGETIDPGAGGDRLAAGRVGAKRRPVARLLVAFVGNGALDDEHEVAELTRRAALHDAHELTADLIGEDRVVEVDPGYPGQRAP
jgi:hypothetical protein